MQIQIHHKSVLDVEEADTLALPVDGSASGLEGNIARQFMKRVGVSEMHELYAPPPYYPFNGDVYWSSSLPHDKTHFRHICCLGMLSHDPDTDPEGYIASAFGAMLDQAGLDPEFGANIACPILRGGRRMSAVDAIYLMLKVFEEKRDVRRDVVLHIAENDPETFELLKSIVAP
jgi:hypothetical protein